MLFMFLMVFQQVFNLFMVVYVLLFKIIMFLVLGFQILFVLGLSKEFMCVYVCKVNGYFEVNGILKGMMQLV